MSDNPVFEKISGIGKIGEAVQKNLLEGSGGIMPGQEAIAPDKALFDSLMSQHIESTKVAGPSEDLALQGGNNSFIDEVSQLSSKIRTSALSQLDASSKIRGIRKKTQAASNTIGKVKTTLQTPGVKVRNSFQPPLQNKLSTIKDNLGVLSKTAGIKDLARAGEFGTGKSGDPLEKLPRPVRKFVKMLTEGQSKLEALDKQLSNMGDQEMSPSKLLAIQIKVGHISHELELFSSLLNKAIESTKTIMNVQV
ncbi:MAG: hypothetical protein ACI9S8_002658 [Chlamydiales bacterium]|jgi:hypothetical protein